MPVLLTIISPCLAQYLVHSRSLINTGFQRELQKQSSTIYWELTITPGTWWGTSHGLQHWILTKAQQASAAIAVLQIWKLRFRARDQRHKCLSYWAGAGNIHGEGVYRATAFLSEQLFLGWQSALVCKKAATQYCQAWFFKRSWKSICFINIKPPNLRKDLVLEQTLENPITASISHTFLCRFITFFSGEKHYSTP